MKKRKIIIYLITFLIIVISLYFFSQKVEQDKKASRKKFYQREYKGVIKEIKYIEGNRGDPLVSLNVETLIFGPNEDKIRNYVQIGDSIVKQKDTALIIVFRKDSLNNWKERKFE